MKKIIRILVLVVAVTIGLSYTAIAQVAINTNGSNPDASAMLDVQSNNKGFLLPRLSVAEIAALSNPADGLQVFNTTDGELYIYVATSGCWKQLVFGMHSLSSDCGFPVTDARDGQTYNTVLIGSQCWMAENMNIGTRIDGQDDLADNSIFEKYCYDDDTLNCYTYGGLYQWAEMVQYFNGATNTTHWSPVPTGNVQGICPTGWHLPTDDEWKTLEMYLGLTQTEADATGYRGTDEGGKLKENGTTHWQSPNTGATNFYGFTALPGGHRTNNGLFFGLGLHNNWWSDTEYSGTHAYYRHLVNDYDRVYRNNHEKVLGFSVRCLKD